jgi:1,2-diacylglycerol 3-alpha-glucosyltransferase
MRIAHFSDTYLPRRDGIVTALHTLTEALGDLGHQNLRVVPRHPDQPNAAGLLRVRSLPCGVAQYRMAAWPREAHVARVAAWRPDVIHVHTPGMVGLLGVFAARRLGLPLVHTYHTDLHAYIDAYRVPSRVLSVGVRCYARRLGLRAVRVPRRMPSDQRRRAILDSGNGLLLGDADAVLVPTAAVLARCGLPVVSDRIHLVPTGVAPRAVPAGAAGGFRARYGLPPAAPVLLCVGRVNREKNIDLLVRAFGHVLSGWPPARPDGWSGDRPAPRLVLVGAVYERRWLAGLLREAGVEEATVTTGQLPPEEVAAAYRAAQVFAFPSRTDTQGLVLLEAALAGLPAVLADPQLHGTGPLAGTGLLAPADPAGYAGTLAGLLADPTRGAALGAAARERALAHTPDRFAATVAGVYRRALAAREPGAAEPAVAAAAAPGAELEVGSASWIGSRPEAVGLRSSTGRIGSDPRIVTGMDAHAGRLVTGQTSGLPPGA